jgi:hypothetical protein
MVAELVQWIILSISGTDFFNSVLEKSCIVTFIVQT